MNNSTPKQLRFPPVAGLSVRGNFDGGTLSSDFGPILLRGIDQQTGLTHHLTSVFDDQRHTGYIRHDLRDLFAQRIFRSPALMRMAMMLIHYVMTRCLTWDWIKPPR